MIEFIGMALLLLGSAFFAYMSCHVVSEQKLGKQIPLPWDKWIKK